MRIFEKVRPFITECEQLRANLDRMNSYLKEKEDSLAVAKEVRVLWEAWAEALHSHHCNFHVLFVLLFWLGMLCMASIDKPEHNHKFVGGLWYATRVCSMYQQLLLCGFVWMYAYLQCFSKWEFPLIKANLVLGQEYICNCEWVLYENNAWMQS